MNHDNLTADGVTSTLVAMTTSVLTEDALEQVSEATARRSAALDADRAWRQAIIDAHRDGVPVPQIAERAGISRQRIYQMLGGRDQIAARRAAAS